MKKIVVTTVALVALAVPAVASAGDGPANGQCVKQGVQLLGGKGAGVINLAANGGLAGTNVVPAVIADHLFNDAANGGGIYPPC